MKEKIAILKSEIENDYRKIGNILAKFEKAYAEYSASGEYSKLIESAFYLSQFYSGFEYICKNIAKTFENSIEDDFWHKSLLDRMILNIEDIRPALLSENSHDCLNEIRAFRHFFRHAYDMDLKEDKFKIVAHKLFALKEPLRKDINNFLDFLESLKRE